MCSVAKGLEMSGRDDVREWLLVSTSADLFIVNAGQIHFGHTRISHWVSASKLYVSTHRCTAHYAYK